MKKMLELHRLGEERLCIIMVIPVQMNQNQLTSRVSDERGIIQVLLHEHDGSVVVLIQFCCRESKSLSQR